MQNNKIFAPINSIKWVKRDLIKPNNYNPNKVSKENLKLLTNSILVNGFTLPIVIRPDMTIQDGFHRWTVSGPDWTYVPKFTKKEIEELGITSDIQGKTLYEILNGYVPTVTVQHKTEAGYMYGTITHNRARGTHLLEPMKAIVKQLLDSGHNVEEISKQLGMKPEEIFRLSDFSREDFLDMLTKGVEGYSAARVMTTI